MDAMGKETTQKRHPLAVVPDQGSSVYPWWSWSWPHGASDEIPLVFCAKKLRFWSPNFWSNERKTWGRSRYMDVSENSGTPKAFIFNRVFHYKPSIIYHHFGVQIYLVIQFRDLFGMVRFT